jgi:hypothetical protein
MMNARISADEWEKLSAYIDDQLNPKEKVHFEELLDSKPDLRAAYQELVQLKQLFRNLPQRKAPRNYTLSPRVSTARPPLFRILIPTFSFGSAVATLLLFITIFLRGGLLPMLASETVLEEPAALRVESFEMQPDIQEESQIITWGSPFTGGMGGGADAEAFGKGGGPGIDTAGLPMVEPEIGLEAGIEPIGPPAEDKPEEQVGEKFEIQPAEENLDLIIGIRPAEERGQILAEEEPIMRLASADEQAGTGIYFLPIQLSLGILAISFGLAAFFLRRKELNK